MTSLLWLRTHSTAALVGVVVLVILAALWGAEMHGRHTQSRVDQMTIAQLQRQSAESATVYALRAIVPVQHRNDSLEASNRSLAVRADSLTRIANERLTSADLVRSRLTVKSDTATLAVDADSVVRIGIPHALALQLAAERLATDSAFAAMQHKQSADSVLIDGLMSERNGLRTQIGLDSIVQVRLRQEIATADKQADAAGKANHPRFGFVAGVLTGSLAALATVVVIALQ